MALSDSSKINISIKKLAGKAQTSNDKDLANEGLSTGVTLASSTIFGEVISGTPSSSALYTITGGTVEYVRFAASFIPGTDTSDGRHGFELKLPSDYESNSSNPKAGSAPFVNNQVLNTTAGLLQMVPTSFGTSYEAKPYYGGNSTKNSGTIIPVLDGRDWYMDYFNGILFQQDPPGTGDHAENPDFVEGYLYIGKFVNEVIESEAASGQFFTSPTAGFLNTTGSTAFAGAHGSSYTVASVGTDVNFFVSGSVDSRGTSARGTSVFGGDLAISGTLAVNLSDAGIGSQFVVTTDGKVGIGTSTPAYKLSVGGNMEVGEYIYHKNDAHTFIRFQGDQIDVEAGGTSMIKMKEDDVRDRVLILSGGSPLSANEDLYGDLNFFVSGSIGSRGTSTPGTAVFGGDLFSSGTLFAPNGLSGSLTRLPDGSSYLVGGTGINISSSSNGAVTVSLGSSERVKFDRVLTGTISSGVDVDVSSDFSSSKFSFSKIDVFINGQMMSSGSGRDYLLNYAKTGSIHFNFDLFTDDIVTTIVNK